jgi:TRAP-type C4-dicarboxylate transport system permease small subunit
MKLLQRVDEWIGRGEGVLLVVLLGVMVILSFVQVILRNLFSESLLWGEILLRHLVLWVGFFGAARATGEGRHITIDAFTRFLSPRAKLAARILTNTFAVVVCSSLLTASLKFFTDEIESGSTLHGDIPSWYSQIIIPAGFGLIIFHFLVRIVRGVYALRTGVADE